MARIIVLMPPQTSTLTFSKLRKYETIPKQEKNKEQPVIETSYSLFF
jgi:hypothetical protein